MDILFIGNFLTHKEGSHAVSFDLANRLAKTGDRVLLSSSKSNPIHRLLDIQSTIITRRKEYSIAVIDVFSGRSFFFAELASWMLSWLDKPYVLTLHGGNLPEFAKNWPGRVKRLLDSANNVTTPSNYLLDAMAHFRSDIKLVPNPIDTSVYRYRIRNNTPKVLIWLRAFHKIYNPSMVVNVMAEISKRYSYARLHMIGPDKGDGSLQQTRNLIDEYHLSDTIEIVGPVPKSEVPIWLDQGEIFLNTTNIDNTPISILEAMASGLSIVSTNVGGIPYLLTDEIHALLVPPDDSKAMVSALTKIFNDPKLRIYLSQNSRKKVEEFDWIVVLPIWKKLLDSAFHASR